MKFIISADSLGFTLKETIKDHLITAGHAAVDEYRLSFSVSPRLYTPLAEITPMEDITEILWSR